MGAGTWNARSSVRGQAAPPERWDPSQHNQKETGRFDG